LSDPIVSTEHAVLFWERGIWQIRDLASRNGTYVNGERVVAGAPLPLGAGDRLSFGEAEKPWTLANVDDPEPCAYREGSRTPCFGKGGLLLLPDEGAPEASIYASAKRWVCERDGRVDEIESGERLVFAEGAWLLFLPGLTDAARSTKVAPFQLAEVTIEFHVSSDEERVDVRLLQGSVARELPRQACLYTLLTLARFREGARRSDWMPAEALVERLRCSREKLNVDIHRIRRLFQVAGVADASQIVERRNGQELRCGGKAISIVRD
jgi:hypothetical protein